MKRYNILLIGLFLLALNSHAVFGYDIYLVRHFEKQKAQKDPDLTTLGKERAKALATLAQKMAVGHIFSTDYNRTKGTAKPISESAELPIQIYDPRALEAFADQLKKLKQNALVVGHSNTTPMLVHLLGGNAQSIDESEYGDLYKLSIDGAKVSTSISQVPPLEKRVTNALRMKPMGDSSARLRMLFNGKEVGFATHQFVKQGQAFKAVEHTSIPDMNIEAIIELIYDPSDLRAKSLKMTGSMGSPVDIALEFNGVQVKGHSLMGRQPYKPQGKISIERVLPAHTYERSAILLNMHNIDYSQQRSVVNWYNGYDDEIKKISIQKIGEENIIVPAGTFSTDKVEVIGGAPSQIYYLDRNTSAVVKIEVPGMPWVYEKVE